MKRKVKIEIDPDGEEEIIIKCRSLTPEIKKLQSIAENGISQSDQMSFHILDREYIIQLSNILFFETYNDKVAAHTKDNMYYTDKTLRELERILPGSFTRISKSCLVNMCHVSSMRKGLSGVCEIYLASDTKIVYASRMYYKTFKEKLVETML